MKNKHFFKPIIAAVLAVVVVVTSIVPVYAAGAVAGSVIEDVLLDLIKKCLTPDGVGSDESSYEENIKYLNKVWLTSLDQRKEVDYNTLSSVYAQLLVNGVPCEIERSRGAAQGYYIRGTGDMPVYKGNGRYGIKGKYFSDGNGSIFYAPLPDNGKTPDSTTVPSTTAPSASKNEGTDRDSTTVTDPTTPSDSTTELNALNRLIKLTVTQIKSIQGVWRTNINMYNIQVKLRRLMWDTIDGINNVTTGIYKQVDLLTGYLPRLDDIYNRLFNIQSASWASVDVENRIYSGVAGIGSRLDSIITNGEVQINTTPLEARLDKLISMYSKVNAVVLDTAAINGGQIKAAVGGELEDVMFWGHGLKGGGRLVYADSVTYTLNDVQTTVVNVPLRGMVLGTSIPSTIDDTDEVLMAGVWQGSNGKYYVSDTYNAVTGEYVQRLRSITYDGSENWKMTAKSDGMNMFWYLDRSIEDISPGREAMSSASWLGYKAYDSTFYNQSNSAAASKNKFTLAGQAFRIIVSANDYPDVASWTSYLSENPLTFWYVLSAPTGYASVDKPVVSILDRATIAIPEGDSTISADRIRITGKYETYDSYTQTADIITAIDRLQLGVAPDLDPIVTRLDTLINQSSDTVVNVVNNNTYITNVYQLDDENDVADRSKEGIEKIGGVFKWLWKHAFKDAFGAADVTKLDGLL